MKVIKKFFNSLCERHCWLSRTFYRTQISLIGLEKQSFLSPSVIKKVTQFSGFPPTSVSYLKKPSWSFEAQGALEYNMTGRCPFFKNLLNLFRRNIFIAVPCFEILDYETMAKAIAYCPSTDNHYPFRKFWSIFIPC